MIELDVDGASVWIWRGADVGMVTAIVDALKLGAQTPALHLRAISEAP